MKIDDLNTHEQNAFGGLIRMLIRSDEDFSEEEESKVNAIGEKLGGEASIWKMISNSAQACQSDDAIKAAVSEVTRPEVQQLVLSVLEQIAESDGVADEEQSLIAWVKKTWKV